MIHTNARARLDGGLLSLPLILVSTSGALARSPMPSMDHMDMGSMPPWSVTMTDLADGAVVTDNAVTFGVTTNGFTASCAAAGKALVPGVGTTTRSWTGRSSTWSARPRPRSVCRTWRRASTPSWSCRP